MALAIAVPACCWTAASVVGQPTVLLDSQQCCWTAVLLVATAGHIGKRKPSASNGEKSFLQISTKVPSSGKCGTCYGGLFSS